MIGTTATSPPAALLRCVVRLLERTRSSGRRQRPHPGRAHDEHRGRPGHLRSHPLNGGRNAARLATTYDFNIVIGAATPTSSRANCRRALSQQTSLIAEVARVGPRPLALAGIRPPAQRRSLVTRRRRELPGEPPRRDRSQVPPTLDRRSRGHQLAVGRSPNIRPCGGSPSRIHERCATPCHETLDPRAISSLAR